MAEPGRTQRLVATRPAAPGVGRYALLASCGTMIAFTFAFMLVCAGLNVLVPFLESPGLALLSAFTAVTFAMPYLFVVLWIDRNEREPWPLVLSALGWGAIMATGVSGLFNDTMLGIGTAVIGDEGLAEQLTASFSAPFIEESSKGAALLALYLFFTKEFDNVLDGVVYGALVGLGFAMFENFTYYTRETDLASVVVLSVIRGIVTGAGTHATFTAFTGAGFGLFRVSRRGVLRWALPPLGLGLAMFAHFSWNTFQQMFILGDDVGAVLLSFPLAVMFLQVPFILLVFLASTVSLWHERRIIEKYLATEQPPVLLDGELHRLVPARRRTWHSVVLLLSLRWGELWTTWKRNSRLVKLAFEKWHMDSELAGGDTEEGREHAVRVQRLRKELEALPIGGVKAPANPRRI